MNLLPLLRNATSLRRVVGVLVGTKEGPIDRGNLAGDNLSFMDSMGQSASMATLLLEEAARLAPEVAFVHDYPGFVKTGIIKSIDSPLMNAIGSAVTFFGWALPEYSSNREWRASPVLGNERAISARSTEYDHGRCTS